MTQNLRQIGFVQFDTGLAPLFDGLALRGRLAIARQNPNAKNSARTHKSRKKVSNGTPITFARAAAHNPRTNFWTLERSGTAAKARSLTSSKKLTALLTITTAMMAPVIVPPMLALMRYDAVSSKYNSIIQDRTGIAVYSNDKVVGLLGRSIDLKGALIQPSNTSADDDLFVMYDEVEGAGDKFVYFGWPVRSMVRATVCHLGAPIEGACGGASGRVQHVIRGLSGGYGGDGNRQRKLLEFIDAPALSMIYKDDNALSSVIFDHVSFGYLPGGDPIVGARNASRAYFGVDDPKKMSLAQKAFLIGVFKYNVPWDQGAGFSEKGLNARTNALNRARDALVKTYGSNDPRVVVALRDLDQPRFLPNRPVDPLLAFGGPVGDEVSKELLSSLSTDALAEVSAVDLTIDLTKQPSDYQALFEVTLAKMQGDGQFVRPLLGNDDTRADALAFQANKDGSINAYASNTLRLNLDAKRRAGSHAKWVLILAMARDGRFSSDSMLCNRSVLGMQNAGGDQGVASCANGSGKVSIARAFGKSMNLPLIDAATKLGDADLRAAASLAGFGLDNPSDNVVRSLVLGTGGTSPRAVAALGNALTRFANGGPAIAPYPYFIDRVMLKGTWVAPRRRPDLDLTSYLFSEEHRHLVRAVCNAPFENGTLAGLRETSWGKNIACGKSSTVAADREQGFPTISKAIIVATPNRTYYTFLGAPDGVLGGSNISILPLGLAARTTPAPISTAEPAARQVTLPMQFSLSTQP